MVNKNETKNDSPAAVVAESKGMSPAERDVAIAQALEELGGTSNRNKQKGIRAKLRRLGHVGGLRVLNADSTNGQAAVGDIDSPKGKGKKGKKAKVAAAPAAVDDVTEPHPLSNTKGAKKARAKVAKKAKEAAKANTEG